MGGVTRTERGSSRCPPPTTSCYSLIDAHTESNTMTGGTWPRTTLRSGHTGVCNRACSLTISDQHKNDVLSDRAIPRASTAEDMLFAVDSTPVHT